MPKKKLPWPKVHREQRSCAAKEMRQPLPKWVWGEAAVSLQKITAFGNSRLYALKLVVRRILQEENSLWFQNAY